MGKEWLYWGGSGGGSSNTAKKRRPRGGRDMEEASGAPGCMCAVFHFLDSHRLPNFRLPNHARLSISPDSSGTLLQDEPTARKGVEAPKNSLELNEYSLLEVASSSSTMKHYENLNIPVGIRIRTTVGTKSPRASTSSYRAKTEDISSSEYSSSPGTKTPTLVARLMGLDLLPEGGSPLLSSSRRSTSTTSTNSHVYLQGQTPPTHFVQSRRRSTDGNFLYNRDVPGTLSFPETPRISLARKSDIDRHRLSLESLKENVEERLDVSLLGAKKLGTGRGMNSEEEINTRAAHIARRIVKQVKDKVSRKVGVDITNTPKSRDDNDIVFPPDKQSTNLRRLRDDSTFSNQSTPSSSPRLGFLDTKERSQPARTKAIKKNQDSQPPQASHFFPLIESIPQLQQSKERSKTERHVQSPEQSSNLQKPVQRSNILRKPKQASDAIRNKKEEPFIHSMASKKSNVSDKNSKKTPLSNELLNINISVPTLLPMRKDHSLSVAHFHNKQESDAPSLKRSTQLSRCSSPLYNKREMLPTAPLPFQGKIQANCSPHEESEQFRYIQRILKRIGIDKFTPVSLAKWYSPAHHPLDPSVFHYIELFHPTTTGSSTLSPRCERRLIFNLVDELLVDILKPCSEFNTWKANKRYDQLCGSELIDILCKKIGEFPAANCQVLQDIDALLDTDMRSWRKLHGFEEEGETLALDIERDIMEKLVHETAMLVLDVGRRHEARHGVNKI